jgi:phosphonate transport system substrate-binding protein
MNEQISHPHRHHASLSSILLVAFLITAFIGATAYYLTVQKPMEELLAAESQKTLHLSGLENPIVHRLDPRYTDANGNMIADPPADPARQIDPQTLEFSYIPQDDMADDEASFKDLMAAISQATGKPVKYFPATTTDEQLVALRDGKLHITALNTGNVPRGVCAAGFVPFAGLGDDAGSSKYQMEILVRPDSTIRTVEELRGHVLTLTDPGSNSGYKAPLVLLKSDYGLLPGPDFKIRFSYSHQQSIKGLADGTYEAIAVANDVLNREIGAGRIKADQFRSIYQSESFPTAAIGYAYNLKPELAAKIRKVVLDFSWKGTSLEKEFAASNQTRFVPVDYKNDWALVRRIDDNIGTDYSIK